MRNPERIGRVLRKLERYWNANPDLRLAQILGNAFPRGPVANYAMEDTEVEDFLDDQLARLDEVGEKD